MTTFAERYGPWALVAGASDGIGAEFARQIAADGVGVVLVARRRDRLDALADEIRASAGVEVRVATVDLAAPGAEAELFAATADLEIGLLVYNAGADGVNDRFLAAPAAEWLAMVRRNCVVPLLAAHHYAGRMVARGCGGILLVTSGAAWAGGGRLATYGGTKAFDLVFAEGLWAELHADGVDVLSLVVGATDTPSLRTSLARHGVALDDLATMTAIADPADVAREGLAHLADGPTWQLGVPDGAGPSLLGALPRRQAVELMTGGHDALFGAH